LPYYLKEELTSPRNIVSPENFIFMIIGTIQYNILTCTNSKLCDFSKLVLYVLLHKINLMKCVVKIVYHSVDGVAPMYWTSFIVSTTIPTWGPLNEESCIF